MTPDTCTSVQTFLVIEECEEYWGPDGTLYTDSGVYSDTLTTIEGCDSIILFDLTLDPTYDLFLYFQVCDSFVGPDIDDFLTCVFVNDSTGAVTLTSMFGCDSTINIVADIINSTTANSSINLNCGNYTAPDGSVFTSSGIHTYTLTNAVGCDSIVTLDLQLTGSNDTTYIFESFCDQLILNDGSILTSDTTIVQHLSSTSGCDSIVIYELQHIASSFTNINETTCDSYYINALGDIYTSSGIYTYVLTNVMNCDSIITLDLQLIGNNIPTYFAESFCDQMVLNDGTMISGDTTIQETYINSVGCDSIVIYEYDHLPAATTNINDITCDDYINPFGEIYSTTGNYSYTLTSILGCDSIIHLDLTVVDIDETITIDGMTLNANQNNATYQWVDCDNNNEPIQNATQQSYSPTTTGNYAVIITSQEGCEEISECAELSIVNNNEVFKNSLSVFPNPSSGALNINLDEAYDYTEISVFNVLGQLTQSGIYSNQSYIDLQLNGASGIYLLVVENKNGAQAEFKIIKE